MSDLTCSTVTSVNLLQIPIDPFTLTVQTSGYSTGDTAANEATARYLFLDTSGSGFHSFARTVYDSNGSITITLPSATDIGGIAFKSAYKLSGCTGGTTYRATCEDRTHSFSFDCDDYDTTDLSEWLAGGYTEGESPLEYCCSCGGGC